jgi:hypothetical protein
VIVCFVEIGEIVDHHFSEMDFPQNSSKSDEQLTLQYKKTNQQKHQFLQLRISCLEGAKIFQVNTNHHFVPIIFA